MARFGPVLLACHFDIPRERGFALEVALVSGAFATVLFTSRDTDKDYVPIIAPESAGRRAAFSKMIHCEGPIDRLVKTYPMHSDFTRRVQGAIDGVREAPRRGCADGSRDCLLTKS